MKNAKRTKYSINASIIVVGAIIAVVLLNSLLIAFDSRMSLEIDLTKDEIYKLSDESKDVLKNIDKDTKIVLFYDSRYENEEQYKDIAQEDMTIISSVVKKYTEENKNITFETLDYYKNASVIFENELYAQVVNAINSMGVSPMFSMALIQGDKYEIADYSTYYTQVYNKELKQIENESNIENVITNKLASLNDDKTKFSQILYTQGHGEKVNVTISSFLQRNSYSAGYINLAESDIPDENPLLIIDSPVSDFTSEEIEKLDAFLKKGGSLQVYFNPLLSNDELPKLEAYLADEWGIIRNHGVINDVGSAVESNEETTETYGVLAIGRLASHDVVNNISDAGLRVMYTSSNALEVRPDTEGALKIEEVITTSGDAVLKTVETAKEPAAADDKKGKFNVMLTATKDNYTIDDQKFTGKVLVCGSSYTMDLLPLQANCANGEVLMNSFEWMNGSVTGINVSSKALPAGALVVTNTARWICFGILVVAIPVVVLAIGIVVFTKRRYK